MCVQFVDLDATTTASPTKLAIDPITPDQRKFLYSHLQLRTHIGLLKALDSDIEVATY
ncbi:MAG: hypothetical protein F6K31_41210 [Symploca sp. SIO2G7]|nr:hypothetical protein [Symploca sp. SIO2G7]